MRIKIIADVGEGLTLPMNYNHLLVGVIYRFLKTSNPEYASFLHNEGYVAAEKRFKLFTFSQLMAERRRIIAGEMHFGSAVAWYVSSPVETFLLHFADTLLTEGCLSIGEHRLQVKDVNVPRSPRFQPEMHFRCLSPIVMTTVRVYKGKRSMYYCRPDDAVFSDLIRQNLLRKHAAIYGQPPRDDALEFAFDQRYIQKRQGRVTRLVDYKGIQIKGVMCPFRVSGSVPLIQTGYEYGFGDKNSAGLGMVEI